MAKKRVKKKKIKEQNKLARISFVFGVLSIAFYYLALPYLTAPDLGYRPDVKTLPPEFQKVLGSKTSSQSKAVVARIPILMYHYIEYVQDPNDKIRISLNIPPSVFEEQIKTLTEAGYNFLTASDLDNIIAGKKKSPKNPILLTFDDGYRDFYTDAYPIIKKYNVKATQYVIVDFLDRPNHMFKSQVKEIAKDGMVEIGAHTLHHVWLKGADEKAAKSEIVESKKDLEDIINKPVNSFAYPFGAFDDQAINLVKEAGYKDAVTTVPGDQESEDNKFFLYRLRPGWRTDQTLLEYIKSDHTTS